MELAVSSTFYKQTGGFENVLISHGFRDHDTQAING
jgi:hypothetical protein